MNGWARAVGARVGWKRIGAGAAAVLFVGLSLSMGTRPSVAAPAAPAAPADTPPTSISLRGTVHDFINQNHPAPPGAMYNPDFENAISDDRGFVGTTLGSDGTPVYVGPATGTITTHGPTDFNMWYHDTPNFNVAVPLTLTLDQVSSSPPTYTYRNSEFFPIDNEGWNSPQFGSPPLQLDNCGGQLHNFSFTFEVHSSFTFQPGEQFSFAGDDDVFVFIDNTLEIDLGGVHSTEEASFTLGQPSTLLNPLNLVAGQTYPFDLFFAERHTCGSDIGMTTSIPLNSNTPVGFTTSASSTAASGGGSISDTATLSGATNPAGSITFKAYGPGNPDCLDPPAFTSPAIAVSGNGQYSSGPFTPPQSGTYLWEALYSGDPTNGSIFTGCGDPGETSTFGSVPLAVTTQASPSVPIGAAISDTATVSGGTNPNGTLTFSVFGPNNFGCTGPPVFTSTVPVTNGDGTYGSGQYVPTATGMYLFVAAYGNDTVNGTVSTGCGDSNESVTVHVAAPSITTTPSDPAISGSPISDVAHLTGGFNPTGTITFTLYSDATCQTQALSTQPVNVNGNGDYNSGPQTGPAPGTYNWVASYSGDSNNIGFTTACGDETINVQPPGTTTTTTSSTVPPTTTSTSSTLPPTTTSTSSTLPPTTTSTTSTVPATTTSTSSTVPPTTTSTSSTLPPTTTSTTSSSTVPPTTTSTSSTVPPSTTSTTLRVRRTTTSTSSTVPPTTSTTSTTTSTTLPPTTTTTTTSLPPTTTTSRPAATTVTGTTTPRTTATTVLRRTTSTTKAPATSIQQTTTSTSTSTTSSSTSTTNTTVPVTTAPVTTAPAVINLRLDRISTPPGGSAVATGHGCVPNSPVALSIGGTHVGDTVASPTGSFSSTLNLNVPVGRYTITANCGITLTATIDVVLSSQSSPPSSATGFVLIMFLVIILATSVLFRFH